MKKIMMGLLFMLLIQTLSTSAMAMARRGSAEISISFPPLIAFSEPPEVVVIPETYVYVVPDVAEDIFFYNGWWWRPWEGRWYRSQNYNSGWSYYRDVPSFYNGVPSGWRNDYRENRWKGHQWKQQRIAHKQVQGNWRNWEKSGHWEKQNYWGVHDLRSQSSSRAIQPRVSQKNTEKENEKKKGKAKSHHRNDR